jgi:hypothetical protein
MAEVGMEGHKMSRTDEEILKDATDFLTGVLVQFEKNFLKENVRPIDEKAFRLLKIIAKTIATVTLEIPELLAT